MSLKPLINTDCSLDPFINKTHHSEAAYKVVYTSHTITLSIFSLPIKRWSNWQCTTRFQGDGLVLPYIWERLFICRICRTLNDPLGNVIWPMTQPYPYPKALCFFMFQSSSDMMISALCWVPISSFNIDLHL